jgi:hypothetical protein
MKEDKIYGPEQAYTLVALRILIRWYILGASLLFVYYLNNPPLIGLEYSVHTDGSYIVVNKTLIEAVALVALVALALFPSGMFAGLDMLISWYINSKNKMEDQIKCLKKMKALPILNRRMEWHQRY